MWSRPPPPAKNKKLEGGSGPIGPYSVVYCPNAGIDCSTPIPVSTNRQMHIDEFTRMYNHDSLNYYFPYRNSDVLFSSMGNEPQLKDSLSKGLYSIVFDEGGNILIRNPKIRVVDAESYVAATRFAVQIAPSNYK